LVLVATPDTTLPALFSLLSPSKTLDACSLPVVSTIFEGSIVWISEVVIQVNSCLGALAPDLLDEHADKVLTPKSATTVVPNKCFNVFLIFISPISQKINNKLMIIKKRPTRSIDLIGRLQRGTTYLFVE